MTLKEFLILAKNHITGDAAYENYLKHFLSCSKHQTPLSKKEFLRKKNIEKWKTVNRCC